MELSKIHKIHNLIFFFISWLYRCFIAFLDTVALLSRCQYERFLTLPWTNKFSPTCTEDGGYAKKQCHGEYCWCVDEYGNELHRTRTTEKIDCNAPQYQGRAKTAYIWIFYLSHISFTRNTENPNLQLVKDKTTLIRRPYTSKKTSSLYIRDTAKRCSLTPYITCKFTNP